MENTGKQNIQPMCTRSSRLERPRRCCRWLDNRRLMFDCWQRQFGLASLSSNPRSGSLSWDQWKNFAGEYSVQVHSRLISRNFRMMHSIFSIFSRFLTNAFSRAFSGALSAACTGLQSSSSATRQASRQKTNRTVFFCFLSKHFLIRKFNFV